MQEKEREREKLLGRERALLLCRSVGDTHPGLDRNLSDLYRGFSPWWIPGSPEMTPKMQNLSPLRLRPATCSWVRADPMNWLALPAGHEPHREESDTWESWKSQKLGLCICAVKELPASEQLWTGRRCEKVGGGSQAH